MDSTSTPRARPTTQPLEIMQVDGALLRLGTVMLVTGLSKATIYRKIRENTFPANLKVGVQASRWRASDIKDWLDDQAGVIR